MPCSHCLTIFTGRATPAGSELARRRARRSVHSWRYSRSPCGPARSGRRRRAPGSQRGDPSAVGLPDGHGQHTDREGGCGDPGRSPPGPAKAGIRSATRRQVCGVMTTSSVRTAPDALIRSSSAGSWPRAPSGSRPRLRRRSACGVPGSVPPGRRRPVLRRARSTGVRRAVRGARRRGRVNGATTRRRRSCRRCSVYVAAAAVVDAGAGRWRAQIGRPLSPAAVAGLGVLYGAFDP